MIVVSIDMQRFDPAGMSDGRYIRRVNAVGRPLGTWHVAKPSHPDSRIISTACGFHRYRTDWKATDDLPLMKERCFANGCRQQWGSQ